jgi:hypothetical protein
MQEGIHPPGADGSHPCHWRFCPPSPPPCSIETVTHRCSHSRAKAGNSTYLRCQISMSSTKRGNGDTRSGDFGVSLPPGGFERLRPRKVTRMACSGAASLGMVECAALGTDQETGRGLDGDMGLQSGGQHTHAAAAPLLRNVLQGGPTQFLHRLPSRGAKERRQAFLIDQDPSAPRVAGLWRNAPRTGVGEAWPPEDCSCNARHLQKA